MNIPEEPLWLKEFKEREANGEADLRPKLKAAWERHAGVTDAMADQILAGVPADSGIIGKVAKWVLDTPDPEQLRECEHCSWTGMEKECGPGKTCPQCGQKTYCRPPSF